MALTLVAAYDVRSDNRRAQLAATLQAYGDRIQKSVFLLRLDDEDVPEILDRVRAMLDLENDSFYIFRQCAGCWQNVEQCGQAHVEPPALAWFAL